MAHLETLASLVAFVALVLSWFVLPAEHRHADVAVAPRETATAGAA